MLFFFFNLGKKVWFEEEKIGVLMKGAEKGKKREIILLFFWITMIMSYVKV